MKVIKNYIDYLKDNPKGYWFKRRLYGWGWTPSKLEGWFVVLGFIFILLLNGAIFALKVGNNNPSAFDLAIFFSVIVLSVILMLVIAFKKGEKPKWTWGLKSLKK